MMTVLIIVVLAGGRISADWRDYPTPAACRQHQAAVLRDPVELGARHPIVVAVCREVRDGT